MTSQSENPVVTIESISKQIEDINRKANALIDDLKEQRDICRVVIESIAACLEYRPGDERRVQVIEGKGPAFWEILAELKRSTT